VPSHETLTLARCFSNSVCTYSILLTRFLKKIKNKEILLAKGAGEDINMLTLCCNHLRKGHYTVCKFPLHAVLGVVTQLPQCHSYSRVKDRISKSGSSVTMSEFTDDALRNKPDDSVCVRKNE
jgi:hypothetical protein